MLRWPRLTLLYVRVHSREEKRREERRQPSCAALIFNVAAPDTAHLFHTPHAAYSVLCVAATSCGYVSWPDYNLPHETHMYLHNAPPSPPPCSCSSNSNRVRSSESHRNSCQSCGPLKLNWNWNCLEFSAVVWCQLDKSTQSDGQRGQQTKQCTSKVKEWISSQKERSRKTFEYDSMLCLQLTMR